jgi:hypothetical protein
MVLYARRPDCLNDQLPDPELLARELNGFSITKPSLLEQTRLFAFETGEPLWPPPQVPLGVLMARSMQFGFDPRFSADRATVSVAVFRGHLYCTFTRPDPTKRYRHEDDDCNRLGRRNHFIISPCCRRRIRPAKSLDLHRIGPQQSSRGGRAKQRALRSSFAHRHSRLLRAPGSKWYLADLGRNDLFAELMPVFGK